MLKVRIHKLGNGRFQTCYLDPKTGKKRRNQFDTQKDAKEHQRDLEMRYSTLGISAFSNERVGTLLKMYLEKFPDSKIKRNKDVFRSFVDKFGSHRISQLTTGDLKEWLFSLQRERNLSIKTVAGYRTQINHLFYFLQGENILSQNPLEKIKLRLSVPPKRPRVVLSVEEVEQLLSNAKTFSPNVLHPYLYTLAHTGMRRGEALKLMREDIDFKTGLIHLRETKNGKERFVKMATQLEAFLKEFLASHMSDQAFPNGKGEKFGREQFTRLLAKFRHLFPMEKDWTPHALRHSLAYNFLKAGGNMYQIQAILGHRHLETTVDLYGQIGAQDVDRPSPYDF